MSLAILAAATLFGTGGCHAEVKTVVGKWKNKKGDPVTFNADHTFSEGTGDDCLTGIWSYSNGNVVVDFKQVGGASPSAYIDKQVKEHPSDFPPDAIEKFKKRFTKPVKFVVSKDANAMITVDSDTGNSISLNRVMEE